MDTYWRKFAEAYVNDPFYWFQPKGAAVSAGSLPTIQRKLRELRRFEGKLWSKAQRAYTSALRRARLYKPTKATATSRDYAAIARMNKRVLDTLGLAWITDQSIVQITDAGRQFLRLGKKGLPEFVNGQLRRYQFPNPSVGTMVEDAGLFPYPTLLAVLTHFPDGIPSECYELFISRIRSPDGVAEAVRHIKRYVGLGTRDRRQLQKALRDLPVLREGRIRIGTRRSSLLNTIHLNRSYMMALLRTPGLVVESGGRLFLDGGRHDEAEAIVQEHLHQDCYIRFANQEDWVAFFGQPGRRPTFEEALLYYRRRGEVRQSAEVFRRAKARKALPRDLQNLDESAFRELHVLEKTLEDFLEFNLDLLEHGLKCVERQYPTATGPLDILAKDCRGGWVVVELKRGRAADKVIGQLLRYRAFIVSERANGKQSRVRGFIVAPEPDRRLILAAEGAPSVPLEIFAFTVKGAAQRLFPKRRKK